MKYISTIILALSFHLILAQTKSANNSPRLTEAMASKVGMSVERLARLDAMCETAVNEGHIPGIVALVTRKGKIVYYKAFGLADNKSKRVLRRDDIFRIASQTKAITATAVMMLWEEGKFRLDDPISKYIAEFENMQVLDSLYEADSTYSSTPVNKQITIRHLLTHTSGIGYGMIDGDPRITKIYHKAGITDLFTIEPVKIEDNIKKLAKLPLHHNPGEKFTYSEGLDVLGYFIEVISGMPFDQFLRSRIFEPLKMNDTYFYLPKSKYDRLVTVQEKKNGKWVNYTNDLYDVDYPIKGAKQFFSGGAGLSSTAFDYATFLQMYLNEGELNGFRLLSRTTVETILTNQIGDIWQTRGTDYGLAFQLLKKKGHDEGGSGSIGTFAWGGYFNTSYFADPKEEIIGIIMKQTRGPRTDDTGWQYRQLIMQAVDD